MYYLRFLCYNVLERPIHRQVALDNIIWASQELALSPRTHTETNHNIIGYCYGSLGEEQKAYREYRKSLVQQKYHNAVIWHLTVLLKGRIRRARQSTQKEDE